MDKKRVKRTGGWTTALSTFVFIVIPALLINIFLGGDFSKGKGPLSLGEEFGVAIGFIAYSFILVLFLLWIQLAWVDIANFIIPTAIVMMGIFLSYHIPYSWARALIAIALMMIALPVNMITTRISDSKIL